MFLKTQKIAQLNVRTIFHVWKPASVYARFYSVEIPN